MPNLRRSRASRKVDDGTANNTVHERTITIVSDNGVPPPGTAKPAATTTRLEFFRCLKLALAELVEPAPGRGLNRRQYRRLVHAGALLRSVYGKGELNVDDAGRWTWNTQVGGVTIGHSNRLLDRHGKPRYAAIARTARRRVRLERELRALESTWLIGECLDAVNGDLETVP